MEFFSIHFESGRAITSITRSKIEGGVKYKARSGLHSLATLFLACYHRAAAWSAPVPERL